MQSVHKPQVHYVFFCNQQMPANRPYNTFILYSLHLVFAQTFRGQGELYSKDMKPLFILGSYRRQKGRQIGQKNSQQNQRTAGKLQAGENFAQQKPGTQYSHYRNTVDKD